MFKVSNKEDQKKDLTYVDYKRPSDNSTQHVYGTSDGNGGVKRDEPHGHTVIKDGEIVSMRTIECNQVVQTNK